MMAALRTPRGLATALILLVLAILPLLTQAFDQRYLLSIGTRIVIWSIAAVSLNMILGYGGLVSFGHAVFFTVGSGDFFGGCQAQWSFAFESSYSFFTTAPPVRGSAAPV